MRFGVAVHLAPALLAAGLLAPACAPEVEDAPAPVAVNVRGLYREMVQLRRDYERGLDLVVEGREADGWNLLQASSKRLRVAAARCAALPGCDPALIDLSLAHVSRGAAAVPSVTPEGDAAPPSPASEDAPLDPRLYLLHDRDLRDLIPWNEEVKASLYDWLTWKRPMLAEALEQYEFLRARIAPFYHEAELPEALLFAIMAKESGVKAHAYSRAGAAGPLQFMPRTALRFGLGSVDGFDLRLDPVAATQANVAYLNALLKTFGDNLELALAAYNLGEGRLRKYLKRHKAASFWEPDFRDALPTETRRYVPQVLAAAWLFLHPDAFGLKLRDAPPTVTAVILATPLSLGEVAVCLGDADRPDGWFRTLRNLNPRLDPTRRQPAGSRVAMPSPLVSTFVERCREESAALRAAREFQQARYPQTPALDSEDPVARR